MTRRPSLRRSRAADRRDLRYEDAPRTGRLDCRWLDAVLAGEVTDANLGSRLGDVTAPDSGGVLSCVGSCGTFQSVVILE
jgi:hypothetical protein